ncbi:type II toxin-antitoxin system HicA family toxin [candidate division WOR-3 bacterium]|nr:type II toxin-antitoxin system HicA family toxin [candidate division WOR-3 bacterium]
MSKLPVISGSKCVKALEKAGFYFKRQEGSHVTLRRDKPFAQVVVPLHKELDRGTLRTIIRHSGLTVNEFIKLL